jgi:hypothetical protein
MLPPIYLTVKVKPLQKMTVKLHPETSFGAIW